MKTLWCSPGFLVFLNNCIVIAPPGVIMLRSALLFQYNFLLSYSVCLYSANLLQICRHSFLFCVHMCVCKLYAGGLAPLRTHQLVGCPTPSPASLLSWGPHLELGWWAGVCSGPPVCGCHSAGVAVVHIQPCWTFYLGAGDLNLVLMLVQRVNPAPLLQ